MPDKQLMDFMNDRFKSLDAGLARVNERVDKIYVLAVCGMGTSLLALVGWIVSWSVSKG